MDKALQIKGLSKSFGSSQVLGNLDWSVTSGAVVGLLGRNGAGKSTLLRCLLGLSRIDAGTVEVLGETPPQFSDAVRGRIGYVPQASRDFGWMKAGDVLDYVGSFYPHWNAGLIAELVGQWQLNLAQTMDSLSEGQRQKISILRALGHDPDLLVLDEPVSALDPIARRDFIGQLLEMTFATGKTIVFSTHITSDLERIAADVALLKGGHIACVGSIDELKERVVRLRISGPGVDQIELPQALSLRRSNDTVVATVPDYSERLAEQLSTAGRRVAVEHLNLEDIFTELNR